MALCGKGKVLGFRLKFILSGDIILSPVTPLTVIIPDNSLQCVNFGLIFLTKRLN
jgi:hypothetical protein